MGIEFRGVSKTYPDGTVAVAEFSCEVPSHRTLALVGTSGSGKTTLMRMVNRMIEPTTGEVLIDGKDVRDLEKVALRRSIGYVPQAGGLLPHRRVLDNVATVPLLNGVSKAEARTHRDRAAGRRVGLDARARQALPGPALRRPAAARRASPGHSPRSPTSC